MDIVVWLRSLGLGKYEAAFRENEIDETVLPSLTHETLKELGVTAVGHRLKLLDAIASLRREASVNPPSSAEAVAESPGKMPAAVPAAEAVGERRYLTVMFCDLVGSTAISAQLDPEEWRDLVGSYLDTASTAVADMGGHVAKKLGDGILALFGYPQAHENDAERAARAALAIQRALAELNRKNAGAGKPELTARIGLDTGPAVVDAAAEIYGDVANVAARVQALADPGAVLLTARMQRQVAGLFVVEERGTHTLKGVPEPTALFKLVRASGAGRRVGQRQVTPLVGREEEIALLMRRWERARQGDGQLLMIVGEPGVGKSRLLEEFHARLNEIPHSWAEWTCSQLLQNTPFHPLTAWGRDRFGGTDVPPEQRLADLENTLAQAKLDVVENVPLLAPLLDIPLAAAPPIPADELRRRQLAAMTTWTMAAARTQAVVMAVEDIHWADPSTLDLLRGMAERGALAPLFVIITARPEFRPPWGTRSHHSTITLSPLDRQQVQQMVAELSARHALPRDVVEGVTERTGGVPLFVEEVTRLLLERGEYGGVQAIPPTLQQSLMARLDRLGSAREVAQIGAVIGRDFPYTLLRALAGIEDQPLQAALDRLADADILLVQGLPPDSVYRFKHALIQDAAYENLLKSRRQALHRRLAELLRDNAAGGDAAEPEMLAHHFTQAAMTEASVEWWDKAGQQSMTRSALVEADTQFARALSQIAALPPTRATRRDQIKLQVARTTTLMHTKGYAAPETKAAAEQARRLIEQAEALGEPPEDPLLLFSVLYGLFSGVFVAFDGNACGDLAAHFLSLAKKQGATIPLMVGHELMGNFLLFKGDIAEGRAYLDRLLKLYDPAEHRPLMMRFGGGMSGMCLQSWALWLLGYPEAALEGAQAAVKNAREIGQAGSLMQALDISVLPWILCGEYLAAKRQLDELTALAEQKGAALWKAEGMILQGRISALTGNTSKAVEMINSGLAAFRSTGATIRIPEHTACLASAYADFGNFENAQRCISDAMTALEKANERWFEAEVNRIAGEISLKSPEPDATKAEAYFKRALAVARQQQAKSWELRAAMSLARLWRDQGKVEQARELLDPVYGWFTEGFDTRDLKDAKALLEELAS
jgi:class 3 adenylate cyclase/predicted ATPase